MSGFDDSWSPPFSTAFIAQNRFTSRVCHCARLTPSSKLTKGAFLRGRKTIILNAPGLAVLNGLERIGPYVVPGVDPEQPRHDLKRLWGAVTKRAGVTGVRLHDLRHTYASFGAGGGLGLPIIGRLLGHSQPATTARYAHLDNDRFDGHGRRRQLTCEISAAICYFGTG